jgi:ectoine hydroxylase-related dioxygenase (phytanoyl-CoA dioxygenase family)
MNEANQLLSAGYCHLPGAIQGSDLTQLDAETNALAQRATDILRSIRDQACSYAEYYQRSGETFIAVPESGNPLQTCRFEYIKGSSPLFRDSIIPTCQARLEAITNRRFSLLKDKCNMKSPGGGAFTAHQDILAYVDFGPTLHVTAALFVDPATAENGALQFSSNYLKLNSPRLQWSETELGRLPIYPIYQGGASNGRILAELEEQLTWETVCAEPGDVLLFNSYVPHRSDINHSKRTRRACFFTFNLAPAGDHYEEYYRSKRADFGNPRFHIATPTAYSAAAR